MWTIWLDTNVQLEAETQIRKLEGKLRLEKDMQLSTTLLASRLAYKVGRQDNNLETLAGCFANLGWHKLP